MYRIEASTVVERSAEDIWAYIADLSMLKAWDHDVLEVRWTAPARLEQTFTIVVDLVGGRPLVGDAGIVTCEPGRRTGWEARPQAPGWVTGGGRSFLIGTYITEPISSGRTRLTRRLELEPHGLLALLGLAIAFLARRERHAEISNLKRILESTGEDRRR
jgi:hypothetical protein